VLPLLLVAAAALVAGHAERSGVDPSHGRRDIPATLWLALGVGTLELLLAGVIGVRSGALFGLEAATAAAALLVAVTPAWPKAGMVGASVAIACGLAALGWWQLDAGEVSIPAGHITDASSGEVLGKVARSESGGGRFAFAVAASLCSVLWYWRVRPRGAPAPPPMPSEHARGRAERRRDRT